MADMTFQSNDPTFQNLGLDITPAMSHARPPDQLEDFINNAENLHDVFRAYLGAFDGGQPLITRWERLLEVKELGDGAPAHQIQQAEVDRSHMPYKEFKKWFAKEQKWLSEADPEAIAKLTMNKLLLESNDLGEALESVLQRHLDTLALGRDRAKLIETEIGPGFEALKFWDDARNYDRMSGPIRTALDFYGQGKKGFVERLAANLLELKSKCRMLDDQISGCQNAINNAQHPSGAVDTEGLLNTAKDEYLGPLMEADRGVLDALEALRLTVNQAAEACDMWMTKHNRERLDAKYAESDTKMWADVAGKVNSMLGTAFGMLVGTLIAPGPGTVVGAAAGMAIGQGIDKGVALKYRKKQKEKGEESPEKKIETATTGSKSTYKKGEKATKGVTKGLYIANKAAQIGVKVASEVGKKIPGPVSNAATVVGEVASLSGAVPDAFGSHTMRQTGAEKKRATLAATFSQVTKGKIPGNYYKKPAPVKAGVLPQATEDDLAWRAFDAWMERGVGTLQRKDAYQPLPYGHITMPYEDEYYNYVGTTSQELYSFHVTGVTQQITDDPWNTLIPITATIDVSPEGQAWMSGRAIDDTQEGWTSSAWCAGTTEIGPVKRVIEGKSLWYRYRWFICDQLYFQGILLEEGKYFETDGFAHSSSDYIGLDDPAKNYLMKTFPPIYES
jgi:hypothetical protein